VLLGDERIEPSGKGSRRASQVTRVWMKLLVMATGVSHRRSTFLQSGRWNATHRKSVSVLRSPRMKEISNKVSRRLTDVEDFDVHVKHLMLGHSIGSNNLWVDLSALSSTSSRLTWTATRLNAVSSGDTKDKRLVNHKIPFMLKHELASRDCSNKFERVEHKRKLRVQQIEVDVRNFGNSIASTKVKVNSVHPVAKHATEVKSPCQRPVEDMTSSW